MKKKYYIVNILKNSLENHYIPFVCETVTKIDTKIAGEAYIFRDLITGKIILPFFDKSMNNLYENKSLTYNNINQHCYTKITQKKVLKFLKSLNIQIIEFYQKNLNLIEEELLSQKQQNKHLHL